MLHLWMRKIDDGRMGIKKTDNSNTFRSSSVGINYVLDVNSKTVFNRYLLKVLYNC